MAFTLFSPSFSFLVCSNQQHTNELAGITTENENKNIVRGEQLTDLVEEVEVEKESGCKGSTESGKGKTRGAIKTTRRVDGRGVESE
jgi:hypothetical protein